MMPAAKHFDPVMGVDVHIIQPPGPVPPVPVPHPFIGFLFDPMDYVPVLGATVIVNGVPRAVAGTAGKTVPGVHFPIGGTFIKPPANECEMFMGSMTVDFDGDAASYMALPVLSCQDIGMPAPFRKWKRSKAKSLLLPTSVVLPIPLGLPVLIGGPPTISFMGMAQKLGLSALGKAFKALKKTKIFKKAMAAFKKGKNGLFKNMKPGFLKCNVLKAEPVNVVTGEVVVEQLDFDIPGRLPLKWKRRYVSGSMRLGVCGYGWETPADARLEFASDGSATFYEGEPGGAEFLTVPNEGEQVRELVDGAWLKRAGNQFSVRTKTGLDYFFPLPSFGQKEVVVKSVRDLCGNSLEFVRENSVLDAIVESAGRRIEVETANGLVRSLNLRVPEEATPRKLVSFDYNDQRDLIAVNDALNVPYRFEYQNHCLTRHTDRRGLSFHYEYDQYSLGGRVLHTWGDGGLYDYHFNYFADICQTEITDSLGHISLVDYDENDFIIREIDPFGGVTHFEYDEVGRTSAVIDPAQNRTEYEYDEAGNLLKTVRADGSVIVSAYDANGKAIVITDPNGSEWKQEWDARGLLRAQISPTGAAAKYDYDANGQLILYTNPRGQVTKLTPDKYGNVQKITDALNHATQFSFDALGNLTTKIDALGQASNYQYDAKSRLTIATMPSGAAIECGYDNEDNLTTYRDENGQVAQLEYFGLGEIAKRLQPDGQIVKYTYDTEERLISVTNQRGENYQLQRDALGRISAEIDYWGQQRKYQYNAAGHLQRSEDALQRAIEYKTDKLGRLLAKSLPDGAKEEFVYDANGNLIGTKNPRAKIVRSFDAEGRLLAEKQNDFTITNQYDVNGNRISRETSIGNKISYAYDALDQVATIVINDAVPIKIERNALGFAIQETLNDQLSRTYNYNADGLLTQQNLRGKNGTIVSTDYEYDRIGNLTKRADSLSGLDQFLYDPMGRIREHVSPEGKLKKYLHDPAGDLLQTRLQGETLDGKTWERIAEYEEIRCKFDAAGNLIERKDNDRETALEWDANNRLRRSVTNGVETKYGYDAQGRRIFKETNGKCTRFYWDGDTLVADSIEPREDDQKLQREFIYYPATFAPIALIQAARTFYYQNEINGAPRFLLDENGQAVWSGEYDALGKLEKVFTSGVNNPLRLQGQYFDEETGLHYNLHRYFDSQIGQFIIQDPLGLEPGENVYRFAPNVWGWVDPLGLNCSSDAAKLRQNMVSAGMSEPSFKNSAHHMVMSNSTDSRMIALRNHLQTHGVDINSHHNGVFLPSSSAAAAGTGLPSHSKIHTDAYKQAVHDRVMAQNSQSGVQQALAGIRQDILNNNFP